MEMDENLKSILDTDIGKITEEGKAKSKKRSRLLIFSAALILIFMGAYAALMPHVKKQNTYNEYRQRLEQGDYSIDVETGFEELGDFKDSAELVLETRYQRAMSYMNNSTANNTYLSAYRLFSKVGDYKDAPEQATEAKYLYAKGLLDRERYVMAEKYFIGLGDYKDSAELLEECQRLHNSANDSTDSNNSEPSESNKSNLVKTSDSTIKSNTEVKADNPPKAENKVPNVTTKPSSSVKAIRLDYEYYNMKAGETLTLHAFDRDTGNELTDITWAIQSDGRNMDSYVTLNSGTVTMNKEVGTPFGIIATTANGVSARCIISDYKEKTAPITKNSSGNYVYEKFPTILSIENTASTPYLKYIFEYSGVDYYYAAVSESSAKEIAEKYKSFLQQNSYLLICAKINPNESPANEPLYILISPDNKYEVQIDTSYRWEYRCDGINYYSYNYSVWVSAYDGKCGYLSHQDLYYNPAGYLPSAA